MNVWISEFSNWGRGASVFQLLPSPKQNSTRIGEERIPSFLYIMKSWVKGFFILVTSSSFLGVTGPSLRNGSIPSAGHLLKVPPEEFGRRLHFDLISYCTQKFIRSKRLAY